MKYLLLYSSVFFNVLTNVGFNLSAINDANPVKKWGYFAGGLVFGLINSFLFAECLKDLSLQVASAIYFSLTIIGLFIAAYFFFNESISMMRLIGTSLIIGGVVLVSLNK
ncbi:MAG: EamA family transporter [Bacteroidetes bacterium]|nr:EamA family transporter [Bacteroidota bacterium]